MYTLRVKFQDNYQQEFFENLLDKSGLSLDNLAGLAKVHSRTFRDWRRGKLSPPAEIIFFLSKKFNVALPEDEGTLINRWLDKKREDNRKGAKARFIKYGHLGTPEGRKKGGLNSIKKRIALGSLLKGINIPEESKDLAELMGILLGDGGLTHYCCTVYLNSETDQEFAYYVSELLYKLFGLRTTIFKHKTHKVWRVMIYSVNLVKYLESKGLFIGNKVHLQVGVPEWVISDQEYSISCIRGLVDTDGCLVFHRYKVNGKVYVYPKISFSNRSGPLLDFVFEGLTKLGMNPKKAQYQVWLYSTTDVKRYFEIVGTRNYKPSIKKYLGEGCQSGNGEDC